VNELSITYEQISLSKFPRKSFSTPTPVSAIITLAEAFLLSLEAKKEKRPGVTPSRVLVS
jgi:hypothetical protein